jgi:conjugative transfer signal peptidase TraF
MQEIRFYFIIYFILSSIIFLAKNIYKNITPSVKLGYYFALPVFYEIRKNDLIIFCLHNDNYINNLKKLHLIMNKQCDNNMPLFIKKVIAIKKDKITINESGIYVNDKIIKNTQPLKYIRTQKLIHTNIFDYVLKDDEFIVIGEVYSSYDSRYFGVINKKDINKIAYKII